MSSLGTHLRELREAKGASLDDIARATRVGRRYLESLESDTLGELPAPVFVKGFIRAYCECLEAEPGEALALYRATIGEPLRPERAQGVSLAAPARRNGPLLLSLACVIVLGLSLVVLRIGFKASAPQAPTASGPARSGGEGSPVPPQTPVPAAVGPQQPAGQRLMVRAVEPTWIRVQVDEGQVTEELMQAGAVREWTSARRFVLTVGNAGGLEMELNGRRLPPLGARGAVIQKLVLPAEAQGAGS